MSELNRRGFLKTVAAAVPAAAAGACGLPEGQAGAATLRPATLQAVGEVVLPGELGASVITHAVGAFGAWLAGYRPAAEVTHGYGTGEIDYTPANPGPGWAAQLDALDLEANERFGGAFATLNLDQRREMVRRHLARERGDRLPDPADARHVALGLLAFWAQTPDATNLCYRARIDPNTCRPLAQQSTEPAPLAGS